MWFGNTRIEVRITGTLRCGVGRPPPQKGQPEPLRPKLPRNITQGGPSRVQNSSFNISEIVAIC